MRQIWKKRSFLLWMLILAAALLTAGCRVGTTFTPSDVTLQVVSREGDILPGAEVTMEGDLGTYGPETADDEGAVFFEKVAPGTYTVSVVPKDAPEFQSTVVVKSGTAMTAEVRAKFYVLVDLIVGGEPNPELNIVFSDNWPGPRYGADHIGWFDPGRWFEFDLVIPEGEEGIYTMQAYAAGMFPDNGYDFYIDGSLVSGIRLDPHTGDWENWRWYNSVKTGLQLEAGTHRVRIHSTVGGRNWNLIRFVRTDG
ncbi:MAG: carbohydrate-binding protein [Limnochordia bacterium]|jgi:hypothetical protein